MVALCAIIADEYLDRAQYDIRSDHLDYAKFQVLLTRQEAEVDFDRVAYEWGTISRAAIAETEDEFRCAIGVEVKDLERQGSGADVELTMKVIGER